MAKFGVLFATFYLILISIPTSRQVSVFKKLGLQLGQPELVPEEEESVDEKVIKLTMPELLRMMGYDPDALLGATKVGDLMTLRQFRSFIRNKIAPIVSPACIGDMIYFADSLLEVALAQYDLSNQCIRDDYSANCSCASKVEETIAENTWAIDVIDSLGKFPAGFLHGNFWLLGDFEECVQISVPKSSMKHIWEGQYCRVDIFLFDKKWSENISTIMDREFHDELFSRADAGEAFVFMPSSRYGGAECSNLYNFKLGTCFPKSCSLTDVQAVIGFALNFPQRLVGQRVICSTNVLCHKELEIKSDKTAIFLLCFLSFTAVIMLFGTLYDYYVYQGLVKNLPNVAQIVKGATDVHVLYRYETENEFYERQSNVIKVLLAFSVFTNGKRIFDTTQKPGQIHCLHGIRVLSMFWIILGHTYYWSMNYIDNPLEVFELPKDFLNQLVLNASLSVDAFYLLSATLIVYLWMKEMKKSKGKKVLSGKLWIMYYVHRYIRLTPVYMIILLIDVFLVRYVTDGPMWNQKGIEPHGCANSWWTNLLYVNNFFWLKEQCMTWTWYLANDMQFYVLTPIILLILWMNHIVGLVTIVLLILATSFIRMGLILSRLNWPPISILMNDPSMIGIMEDYWNDIYIKPYCRCGPFLIGLILGYVFYKTEMKIKMPKWVAHVVWVLAAALGVGIVFGLYDYSKTAYITMAGKVIYSAFGRVLWAIALAWVIFACSTGYGGPVNAFLSWKFWMPLSRLVYCAYLIHPILIIIFYSGQMRPIHFSGHFLYINYYFVHIFLAFVFGLVLSLAFEVPIMGLEKIIFGTHVRTSGQHTTTTSALTDAKPESADPDKLADVRFPQAPATLQRPLLADDVKIYS